MASIKAISVSDKKGIRKDNIASVKLIPGFGLEGDAHGGGWHRQVSLLAQESIDFMKEKGLDVVAGNFAENLTTEGLDLTSLPVGTKIRVGNSEMLISQLGKICHTRCAIYHQAGDCVMPREGIFAVVEKGAEIAVGDSIEVLESVSGAAAIVTTRDLQEKAAEIIQPQVVRMFSPPFIRLDTISNKEGGSLQAILDDLTKTQKIDNIIIFDPTGTLGLTLSGQLQHPTVKDCYQIGSSKVFHLLSEQLPSN